MKAKIKSKLETDKHVPLQNVIPLDTPFLIYLDPSSRCNFKCSFCPSGYNELMSEAGYERSIMNLDLFKKFINDLKEFNQPIKVLRMNKIGEPFLNKNLHQMISYAKESGAVQFIDLATNASLFSKDKLRDIIHAGIDRLNISIEGVNKAQYQEYAKINIDFDKLVENIQWLYQNKNQCEINIKIPADYINESEKQDFFSIFGDYCDRIFIENLSPIWPYFDIEEHSGIPIRNNKGQYDQELIEKEVCTYIFYSVAVNADGTVSACCPDWQQKLIVGDIKNESFYKIWNSYEINKLRRLHLEGNRRNNLICRNCGHINFSQVDNIDQYREQLLNKFIDHI